MKKGRVFIVDDGPQNIQLLGRVLIEDGYEVMATTNPKAVVNTAKKSDIDLILLDLMMPDMDGFEVCELLKADSETSHIPVIFLTAKVDQESVNYGLTVGGVDYITKPFNVKELLCRVHTHVSKKKSEEALQKKTEELEHVIRLKDQILSVIGHDLRTPMAGIMGFLDLLKAEWEEEDENNLDSFLEMASNSAKHMNVVFEDLLSWGKMHLGSYRVESKEVDVMEVINEIVSFSKFNADKKNLSFNVEIKQDKSYVWTDKRIISTILRNFISNAIKFSNENSDIDIIANEVEDRLELKVKDYGIGLDKKTESNIFDENLHPRNSSEKNINGSGYGLLMCKKLAEEADLDINVKGVAGKGAEFSILVPRVEG